MAELRKALEGSLTEGTVADVVAALVGVARLGDTSAAALLLAYACGKPRQAPQTVKLDLPALTDAAAVADALKAVAAAVAAGDLDVEAAQQVAALVVQVGTAVAWQEVADRVAALERRAP